MSKNKILFNGQEFLKMPDIPKIKLSQIAIIDQNHKNEDFNAQKQAKKVVTVLKRA